MKRMRRSGPLADEIPVFFQMKYNHLQARAELHYHQLVLVQEKVKPVEKVFGKVRLLQNLRQFQLASTLQSQSHAGNASASNFLGAIFIIARLDQKQIFP